MEGSKIVFRCKHCDNDDLRYMKFMSLNKQSPQYQNHMYRQNWDYETTPKVPVGIHIRCAKCGKDTFIIPDMYGATEWGNDIPEQCIIIVKYEKPQFSAIQYVMTDDGYLDRVVITSNNEKISLVTEKVVDDNTSLSVIGKKQYEILLSRGLQEVPKTNSINEGLDVEIKQEKGKSIKQNGGDKK